MEFDPFANILVYYHRKLYEIKASSKPDLE